MTSVTRKIREMRSNLGSYEANAGGVGVGRGEPLAATRLKPGGVGVGRGEPLAAMMLKPGGVGVGRGEPLIPTRPKPGGVGVGRGEPLLPMTLAPGGVGVGSGDPLRIATETLSCWLLDNCLTELLTGSTIETAKASNDRRIETFFIMAESLLLQP
jgi:hypothetical protein